ncbi:MAG TPA: hypothetical protein PLS20_03815 [Ruminococcus flavefaciens]|nr:hypothetical protein [Ruminococcus flavefaciens]
MEELIRKALNMPASSKHYFSLNLYLTERGYSIHAYIHDIVDGSSVGIADSINSIFSPVNQISAFLDEWAEIIAEEAKHDNERTS